MSGKGRRRESERQLRLRAFRLARKFKEEYRRRDRGEGRRRDWRRDPDWRAFNETQRIVIQLVAAYRIRMPVLRHFADVP